MPWVKRSAGKYDLMIDGDVAGYIVKVKYKNGAEEWQGLAMYRKTRAVSKAVRSKNLGPVKTAVERMARAQRA